MGDIRLHPTLGVNPRLTICPICGGDGNELLLIGDTRYKYICTRCEMTYIGRPEKKECRCGAYDSYRKEPLEDNEKFPGEPCSDCVKARDKVYQDANELSAKSKQITTEPVVTVIVMTPFREVGWPTGDICVMRRSAFDGGPNRLPDADITHMWLKDAEATGMLKIMRAQHKGAN
jgi:hypothetical protein